MQVERRIMGIRLVVPALYLWELGTRKDASAMTEPTAAMKCSHCRDEFNPAGTTATYCGEQCRSAANKQRGRELYDALCRCGDPITRHRIMAAPACMPVMLHEEIARGSKVRAVAVASLHADHAASLMLVRRYCYAAFRPSTARRWRSVATPWGMDIFDRGICFPTAPEKGRKPCQDDGDGNEDRRACARFTPPTIPADEPVDELDAEGVEVVTITVARDAQDRLVFGAQAFDWVSVLAADQRLGLLQDAANALADLVAQELAKLGDAPDNLRVIDGGEDDAAA